MRRWTIAIFMTMSFVATACASDDPAPTVAPAQQQGPRTVSLVDDVGRTVALEVPVTRVIAFNTRNTEFVRAVGAMPYVVGLSDSDATQPTYWPNVDLSRTTGSEDWEKIVSLDPEVVIYANNGPWEDAVAKLEPFGIKVVVVTGWDLLKHHQTIKTLGTLFDKPKEADAVNAFYDKYKALLVDRLKGVAPKPVYLENNSRAFVSPVRGSGWHDMIETGGGKNIFDDIAFGATTGAAAGSVHAYPVDPEAVLLRRPAAVIKLDRDHGYVPPKPGELQAAMASFTARPGWESLPAVQNKSVHVMSGFIGNACSKIIGALYVAKWLHPDLFRDVDPDAVMREWTERFQGLPLANPSAFHLSA